MPLSDDNVNIDDIKCNKSVYVHTSRLEDVPSVLSHRVLPVDFYFLICAAVENKQVLFFESKKKQKTLSLSRRHTGECGRTLPQVRTSYSKGE